MPSTIVVIPAYNQCKSLRNLLPKIDFPFIVIDDGSTDGTLDYLLRENILHLYNEKNSGVSVSLANGVKYALEHGYDRVVTFDSDGQHDQKHIRAFCEKLDQYDFVYGNRFSSLEYISSAKIASNMFASMLTLVAFGVYIPDAACGFRGFRLEAGMDRRINSLNAYQFVYYSLFDAIIKGKPLSAIEIEPIYYVNSLLCTRYIEIVSLIETVFMFTSLHIAGFDDFYCKIRQREDTSIAISDCPFYFYYVSKHDAYIIQCDIKKAYDYYRR